MSDRPISIKDCRSDVIAFAIEIEKIFRKQESDLRLIEVHKRPELLLGVAVTNLEWLGKEAGRGVGPHLTPMRKQAIRDNTVYVGYAVARLASICGAL